MTDNRENSSGKKKMTVLQKISLNIKIILLIIVIILVGFFFVYMWRTSLDDVLTRESYDSNGAVITAATNVYENGGESPEEDSGQNENSTDFSYLDDISLQ